jgi:hypothetical protein
MSQRTSPLDYVTVAAPCSAGWDNMIGNERVRFCGQCQLNVYNLSAMTKQDAERLVSQAEGRLCVRYYRRADGTILTRNCPVGLRALKRRLTRIATATASAVISFCAGILAVTGLRERPLSPVAAPPAQIKINRNLPFEEHPVMGTYPARNEIKGEMFVVGDYAIVEQGETAGEVIRPERQARPRRNRK